MPPPAWCSLRYVAHGDQQVSGAGDAARFALLDLLFPGVWPQGFQQAQAATPVWEPAQHPVIHSTGCTGKDASAQGVFGVPSTWLHIVQIFSPKAGLQSG